MSKTKPEYYEFEGEKAPIKTLDAPKDAVDLLMYIEQNRKARELEMMMWAEQASHVRQQILQALGLDLENSWFDFDRLLADGKLRYADLGKIKNKLAKKAKKEGANAEA